MKKYLPRIADEVLSFKLRNKGAVLVEGAKWCGKSTTCKQHAELIILMQDTETRDQNIALAYTSASTLLAKQPPLLIAEWKEACASVYDKYGDEYAEIIAQIDAAR